MVMGKFKAGDKVTMYDTLTAPVHEFNLAPREDAALRPKFALHDTVLFAWYGAFKVGTVVRVLKPAGKAIMYEYAVEFKDSYGVTAVADFKEDCLTIEELREEALAPIKTEPKFPVGTSVRALWRSNYYAGKVVSIALCPHNEGAGENKYLYTVRLYTRPGSYLEVTDFNEEAISMSSEQEPVAVTVVPNKPEDSNTYSMLDTILAERGSRYGEFDSHAALTQLIKSVLRGDWKSLATFTEAVQNGYHLKVNDLSPSQMEALDMIAHKIGRILNGDPNYDDSWVDIAGYAQLIVQELQESQKQPSSKVETENSQLNFIADGEGLDSWPTSHRNVGRPAMLYRSSGVVLGLIVAYSPTEDKVKIGFLNRVTTDSGESPSVVMDKVVPKSKVDLLELLPKEYWTEEVLEMFYKIGEYYDVKVQFAE